MSSNHEGLAQAVPNFEPETTVQSRITLSSRAAGRIALSLALAAGTGLTAGAASEILKSNPTAAAAATGDYPWADAPAVAGQYLTWGYSTKAECDNKSAAFNCANQTVGGKYYRDQWAYDLRNCTSYVAWKVAKEHGVSMSSLGNASNWDNAAPSRGWSVDGTPEVGDIAQWDNRAGGLGHVAFVTNVNTDGSTNIAHFNTGLDGNYSTQNNIRAERYIDVNGPNASPPPAVDPLALSFVRLNYPGNIQVVSYLESSNYHTLSENALAGYPSVPPDGNVVPLFQKDGDLSLVRLNHGSGHVEVATYSEASNYQTLSEYSLSGYPSVPGNGSVIPLYQYDGDLSFIRLNHGSGKTEVISYSAASNYQALTESTLTNYPAVTPDGSVIPAYWLNDDLVFFRMNHSSGNVELASYSKGSNYQQLANYQILPYPAVSAPGVTPDGAVTPMFQPQDGDLSFVRLNHSSGKVEIVTYAVGSQFQQMNDYDLSNYPAVPPDGAVVSLYSN